MFAFIELHPFAAVRDKYLSDDDFGALQLFLVEHPDAGNVIPTRADAGSCDGQPGVKESEVA